MTTRTITLFDLAPGKTLLDRYKIRRANRHGGMSTTFEVELLDDGELLEVQIFPAALFESRQQAEEFAAAMSRWKGVRAKSVIAARDVHVLEDGTILYVTDLPPGRSLRAWEKERAGATPPHIVPPAQVVDIGRQLLDELSAIHAADLVHGDIKPHTIHIEERKGIRVTLVDGGITPALWSAKHLGDKTALIGTPFYAPVEQFGGESPDVQSDLYNLATVLYELATGVLPWKGSSFLEVFQAKLQKKPTPMRSRAPKVDVPPELEAAIAGGLMAGKDERYRSAAEFQDKLAAVAVA